MDGKVLDVIWHVALFLLTVAAGIASANITIRRDEQTFECGDLSALWYAATRLSLKNGDRSPWAKAVTYHRTPK